MTCKDCIHDGVCHIQEMSTDLELEEYLKEFGCEDFKNKADFVEVVFCKDCRYWRSKNSKDTQGVCACGDMDMNYGGEFYPFADDFCSYGKKE